MPGWFHVRGPVLPRVVGVLLVLGSLSPGLASALAGGQVQSKDQQNCINELNKRFRNVAKTQGREVVTCIRAGSRQNCSPATALRPERQQKEERPRRSRCRVGPGSRSP